MSPKAKWFCACALIFLVKTSNANILRHRHHPHPTDMDLVSMEEGRFVPQSSSIADSVAGKSPGPSCENCGDEICLICLENVTQPIGKDVLPCHGHQYDRKCIENWLATNFFATCPSCREQILLHNDPALASKFRINRIVNYLSRRPSWLGHALPPASFILGFIFLLMFARRLYYFEP